uniref:Uncharacterized protein n=1 Tax=Panagrolaimus superbus TaxID=310955 RepID=A0A914XWS8_9BILA
MTTTTTFSFPALPWIFQKRFTEICDTPTMLKFKELSPQTRELSKNRKICKKLRIGDIEHGEECNRDICKCLPGQVLQNVPFADIQNVEIIEEMKIDLARRKTTAEFIQSFSFIASELSLTSFNIEFDALKILLERNLKRFVFLGTIVFNNFDQDFAYLINRLIDINEVV